MERPLCPVCRQLLCAPNYWRDGVHYWRSKCSRCIRIGRQLAPVKPRWQLQGYKKKDKCDICGFKAKWPSQMTVWHLNGNLNDGTLTNLRSVCLCCVEEVKRKNFTWKPGDLTAD